MLDVMRARVMATLAGLGAVTGCSLLVNLTGLEGSPAAEGGAADATSNVPDGSAVIGADGSDATTAAPIKFVQSATAFVGNSGTAANLEVAMSMPLAAGHTLVAIIAWGQPTGDVKAVADSAGNVFVPVGGIMKASSSTQPASQRVYYVGSTIAAASEDVKVAFDGTLSTPDIRLAEYSGLSANPVFAGLTSTATDFDASAATGALQVPAGQFLVVAGATAWSDFTGACPGFDVRLNNGDQGILADKIVNGPGTFTAAPPVVKPTSVLTVLVAFH